MIDSSFDYDAYEKKCEVIRAENEEYLDGFEQHLIERGLSKKTVRTHVSNAYLYISEFLLYEEAQDLRTGCGYQISLFLGDWFIRKAMWSSPANIRSNAASIKKFYKYLLDNDVVEQSDYDALLDVIKTEMPRWLERMQRYDDDDDYCPCATLE